MTTAIINTYSKANKERRKKILTRMGVTSFERLKEIVNPSTNKVYVGKTEIAALLSNATNQELTVCFNKSVKPEDVLKEIMEVYKNSTPNTVEKEFKKILNSALKGEKRVATGFHNGKLDNLGKLFFVDINKTKNENQNSDSRMIVINLQEINWITIGDIEYIRK